MGLVWGVDGEGCRLLQYKHSVKRFATLYAAGHGCALRFIKSVVQRC